MFPSLTESLLLYTRALEHDTSRGSSGPAPSHLQQSLFSWSLLYLWPSVEVAPTTIHFRQAGLSLAVAVTGVYQVTNGVHSKLQPSILRVTRLAPALLSMPFSPGWVQTHSEQLRHQAGSHSLTNQLW